MENSCPESLIYYYMEDDILMRKWRPDGTDADKVWMENHEVLVTRYFREVVMELAHSGDMAEHLGVRRLG